MRKCSKVVSSMQRSKKIYINKNSWVYEKDIKNNLCFQQKSGVIKVMWSCANMIDYIIICEYYSICDEMLKSRATNARWIKHTQI